MEDDLLSIEIVVGMVIEQVQDLENELQHLPAKLFSLVFLDLHDLGLEEVFLGLEYVGVGLYVNLQAAARLKRVELEDADVVEQVELLQLLSESPEMR